MSEWISIDERIVYRRSRLRIVRQRHAQEGCAKKPSRLPARAPRSIELPRKSKRGRTFNVRLYFVGEFVVCGHDSYWRVKYS